MTNAQLLRHLRRHPHRHAVATLLLQVSAKHYDFAWHARLWSSELQRIALEIVR